MFSASCRCGAAHGRDARATASLLRLMTVVSRPMFLACSGQEDLAPESCIVFFHVLTNWGHGHCDCRPGSEMSTNSITAGKHLGSGSEPIHLSIAEAAEFSRDRSSFGFLAPFEALKRRWRRERRRRAVGRAYDMALEIARVLPVHGETLDVGCGNGFIAHHLSALLETPVMGIDLSEGTQAAIRYEQYDGCWFPVADKTLDAVLLCYVLHHAQDVQLVLNEVIRTLRHGSCVVVYEDMPDTWFDRAVCWSHNLQWRYRTGPCTFRKHSEWRELFQSFGFTIVDTRPLSRWRNLSHPVRRRLYVLKYPDGSGCKPAHPSEYHLLIPRYPD